MNLAFFSAALLFTVSSLFLIAQAAIIFRRKVTVAGVSFRKKLSFEVVNGSVLEDEECPFDGYSADLLLVADFSVYESFREMNDRDEFAAQFATNNYLNAIFEQVRSIFSRNPLFANAFSGGGSKVLLNLAASFVVIRPEDCPFLSNRVTGNATDMSTMVDNSTKMELSIEGLEALHLVHQWVEKYEQWLPKHDHAVVFTKFDLLSTLGDSSTQGMTYVGSMCRPRESASVVEDTGGMATALTTAHELAHSLGAHHDGTGASKDCRRKSNYLMSPSTSSTDDFHKFHNSFRLSSCSLRQIESFIKNGSGICLRETRLRERRLRRTSPSEERRLPGEMIIKSHQCKIAFAPHYGICKQRDWEARKDVCKRLWCRNRLLKRNAPCETKTYLPLLDGTACGHGKWCIEGRCVESGKDDTDCVDMNRVMCSTLTKSSREGSSKLCASRSFLALCCHTCASLTVAI